MSQSIEFRPLLRLVQEHTSQNYAAALTDQEKRKQLGPYIEKYLRDHDYYVTGMTGPELIGRLYQEMAEYSILTPYLNSPDLEEINLNSWDDLSLTYTDGRIVKSNEHFDSPQHAVDIVKRLLHNSGIIIDNATPMAQGHLPPSVCESGMTVNTRVTALKEPLVDGERGISVSIRLLHPQTITLDELTETGLATKEMIDFLCLCVRYGVSFVIAGATGSGKTTLLNALLGSLPDDKRIFTIESGSRELSLVRTGTDGRIVNNVVHTLSRSSDNPAYDITQENLVVASLRFNPDIVCVGEMRDTECCSAVEASLTGHTVVSTVHSGAAEAAHTRIALLCQKRFPIDFNISMIQAGQAFPLIVYCHQLEDHSRKIMDISECAVTSDGERCYRSLYSYHISQNTLDCSRYMIKGCFHKENVISDSLKQRLVKHGAPQDVLNRFLQKGADLPI